MKGKRRLKRFFIIMAAIIGAAAVYCGADQIVYRCRKAQLESIAQSYVAQIAKINTYEKGDDTLDADVLANKKAHQLDDLEKKYCAGISNKEMMKQLVLQMKKDRAKMRSFKVSDVKITSSKLPWKFQYELTASYKIEADYEGAASFFNGASFTSENGGKKPGHIINYCQLLFGMKKQDGKIKIVNTALVLKAV